MKRFIALILSIILLLSACSHTPSTPEETCRLYYFSSDSIGTLHTLEEKIPDASQEDIIRDIYSKLCSPKSKKLVSMIPAGIKLESQSIAGGICAITLSEKYTELPEYTKSIVDTCLTKTFCSLTYIDHIIIMSGNESFEFSDGDFITSTPSTHYDSYTVNLYFANETFDALCADSEIIFPTPGETLEHAVVSKLLNGPESDKMRRTIPVGTQINNIYVSEEGVCVIDFSRAFIDNVSHENITEALTLYSVVNTVTELPMINRVKFLIDGESVRGYAYYDLTKPFTNSSEFLVE